MKLFNIFKKAKKVFIDEEWERQLAYIELNNLYLSVQRGDIHLNVTIANQLRYLPSWAYEKNDPMIDWWYSEFEKLPGWLDI